MKYLGLDRDISPVFESEMYKLLMLGVCRDGCPAGALRGVIPVDRPGFFSLDRFALDAHVNNVRGFSRLADELRRRQDGFGVRRIAMRYRYEESTQTNRDQMFTYLSSFFTSWYSVTKKEMSSLRLGLTADYLFCGNIGGLIPKRFQRNFR